MNKTLTVVILSGYLAMWAHTLRSQVPGDFTSYHNYSDVLAFAGALQKADPSRVTLHKIAVSPGGRDVTVIEIGSGLKQVPAVFVGANFEGRTPLATEGALYLAKMLLDSSVYTRQTKWFILPLPNPDAVSGFFSKIMWERTVNDMEVNNDVDDQANEDGPDDINGDGFITLMRVEDPEGDHVISPKDARIMIKADTRKGERGKYKIVPEGLDNDGDGKYNEDGPGGINVGISFPHLFSLENKESGLWPGQAPETYGIMDFMFRHPEIAMAITLGTSDFCISPPKGGRKGDTDLKNIKVPQRYASRFGIDPEKTYSMQEVMDMLKSSVPGGREITSDIVAGMLGLGAAVNPLEDDLLFYTAFSAQYRDYLVKRGCTGERMDADPDRDGSFELWAYYHLGIPSFSMNLFTPPKPAEVKTAESALTPEEAVKMGTDKRSPAQLMDMTGNTTRSPGPVEITEKDKILLSYIDKHPEGKGFISWKPFNHPALGKAEIGGYVPFVSGTPPAGQIDSLCKLQLPWLLQLSSKLPEIGFLRDTVTHLGAGIFRLELYIENTGTLPYPIAMGARNRQPPPVVILLDGDKTEFLEGYSRTPLETIGGNQVKKLAWIIRVEGKTTIKATIESAVFGNSVRQIKIGG